MNGSQLMGLDNVGTEIYAIQRYFHKLTVGQWTRVFRVSHSAPSTDVEGPLC